MTPGGDHHEVRPNEARSPSSNGGGGMDETEFTTSVGMERGLVIVSASK